MTSDKPPAGLYSPDGKYWWDGNAWQPAEEAPDGQAAAGEQTAGPDPADLDAATWLNAGQTPAEGAEETGAGRAAWEVSTRPGGIPTQPAAASGPSSSWDVPTQPWAAPTQPLSRTAQSSAQPMSRTREPSGPAPTEPLNAPVPQSGAPAPAWGPGAPPRAAPAHPQGQGPRRGSRTGLLVGFVALVALLIGVATGGLLGSNRGTTAGAPTEVPPLPDTFPGASTRYLQGVAVSGVVQEWQSTGASWTCGPFEPGPGGAAEATRCTVGPDLGNAFTLVVQHDGDTQIREMNLTCEAGPQAQSCQQLATWFAGSALAGEPDRQQEAQDWAAANFASDLSTTIGGVHLQTRLEPQTLFVFPAP